jgi:hypothetical protein
MPWDSVLKLSTFLKYFYIIPYIANTFNPK